MGSIIGTFFWDNGYMAYLDDIPGQLMQKMTPSMENIPVFIAWIMAYFFGFLLYTEAMKVEKRQKLTVYPISVHAYMMTIDITGVITYALLAIKNHFFWYFDLQVVALAIWVLMEARSVISGVKDSRLRNMEWGKLAKGGISEKKAWMYVAGIWMAGFGLNWYLLSLIGGFSNCAIWIVYPFTSYVYAVFTWRFWDQRAAETGMRASNSIGIQVAVIGSCLVGWVPGLSWYWSVTPFYHQPWTIIGGAMVTVIAIYTFYKCAKLPKYDPEKLQLPDEDTYKG